MIQYKRSLSKSARFFAFLMVDQRLLETLIPAVHADAARHSGRLNARPPSHSQRLWTVSSLAW
jgi:hypothetical protein